MATAEWWNLDQALIWLLTRDGAQVAEAEGDPEGKQPRRLVWFGHEAHSYLLNEDGNGVSPEPEETDASQEGAQDALLRCLREGTVRAQRADQDELAVLQAA